MNAGAVVGEKAALNALVGHRQGNVRQGEPDDEVTAQAPALPDHRTRISLLFRGLVTCGVPGCTDQLALPRGRKSNARQMLRIASEDTGIRFRSHIGQWRTRLVR